MCGIFFSCSRSSPLDSDGALRDCLEKRGPDHRCTVERRTREPIVPGGSRNATRQAPYTLTFFSTVLSLRGDHVVKQPLVDPDSSSVLCWNGEAWKIDDRAVAGNDAEAVFTLLLEATATNQIEPSAPQPSYTSVSLKVIDVFSRITGPYAFVYFDAPNAQLFFGRDALGRRSLLTNKHRKDSFAISSICGPESIHEWDEVKADCIYQLHFCGEGNIFTQGAEGQENSESSGLFLPDAFMKGTYFTLQPIIAQSPRFPPFNKAMPNAQLLILNPPSLVIENLASHLEASLRFRAENVPVPPSESANPPRLAIMFSGGLDCTLLARLVHDVIPRNQDIDLLNVAFENPRVAGAALKHSQNPQSLRTPYSSCPDRITGISSHAELKRTCPERVWRFVYINIPYTETIEHRPRIVSLIQPNNTEMDLSIATALYFAARGRGVVQNDANRVTEAYTTPARVLLSGLGADEIFGGYQRHATSFSRGGYPALADELELDFNRLGTRNLGRDDRVISHWGKEVRYPYLDEGLVAWALRLLVWEKCSFGAQNDLESQASGLEPGKKLLRLLAWKKGLHGAAFEKKRAIQFGARTAKMELGKTKGTQRLS